MGTTEQKNKVAIALRKAKTSLEKILDRIEQDDAECFPAMQQTLAVIGLLKSANALMLESHIEREMDRLPGGSSKRATELRSEILRVVKTLQNK